MAFCYSYHQNSPITGKMPFRDLGHLQCYQIGLTTVSRLRCLDGTKLFRLLDYLDTDTNFQMLLKTTNNSLLSLYSDSVESVPNGIDRADMPANKHYDRPRPDQLCPPPNVCPTQLVVNSLDPPLAPTSDSVQYAGNTAAGMRFPTPTSPGQDSRRGFSTDIFSRSDLDKLINLSLSEFLEKQHSNRTVADYHIWRTTCLEDGEVSERSPVWSPILHVRQQDMCRHQILPFFYNYRWQLAIFDTFECTLCCYDTMGDLGTPMSTFVVSIALWPYIKQLLIMTVFRCFNHGMIRLLQINIAKL